MVEIFGLDLNTPQIAFIAIFLIGGIFAPWYGQYTKVFFDALVGLPFRSILEFVLNGLIGDSIGIGIWSFIKKATKG